MKKIASILAVLICVFSLTACGSSNTARLSGEELPQDEEQAWVSSGEQVVTYLEQIAASGQADQLADDELWGPALESWDNAIKDIGTVQNFQDEYAVQSDKKEISINIGIDGSDHDANVVIVAEQGDSGVTPTSIVTNVTYSFGELMIQAALNTVLGMGTTFCILIILALLISCFKFIGVFQKKKPAAAPAPAAPALEETAPAEAEAQTSDDEIAAVIAAAVAAYESDNGRPSATHEGTDSYVVRSIRRIRRKG